VSPTRCRASLTRSQCSSVEPWDLTLNTLIADPLPREGAGFSITLSENEFGDRFLTLATDEFSFVVEYDVYPWPESEENPFGFEGKVNIFRLA
jgi:hypothetical protein